MQDQRKEEVKKYHIITFGCQMNLSDSERMASVFESMGFHPAPSVDEADLIAINMCSVRQSAVDRIFGLSKKFLEMKKEKGTIFVLTGCILESDKKKFKIFDYILNKDDMHQWPSLLSGSLIKESEYDYLKINPKRTSSFQGFVPISNGCDNFCTYCAVPYTRGRLVSRNHQDIIKEIQELTRNNYKEIWLLGENVNSYVSPTNNQINFAELIREIDKIPGDFWLRFTSPHPKDFSDDLIDALVHCSKFAPYINLPAQSGDDTILRRMNRPYTKQKYLDLLDRIKMTFQKNRKGLEGRISISTDIIVGFPGETDEQFQNTADLFKKARFDMAFIAQYSPRPESHCYKNMPDDVKKADKRSRHKELTALLINIGNEENKAFQDKIIPVLVFEQYKGYYLGRNRHNKAVKINSKQEGLVGQIINVRVTKTMPLSLEGVLSEHED